MTDGSSPWGRIGNVDPRSWETEAVRGKWIYAMSVLRPGLRVRFCFVDGPSGPTCIGIMLDRDGDEVTARDLRIPIGGFLEFGRKSLGQFARIPAPKNRPRPPRRGPKGLPEGFYADVWQLYQQALRADRRRPIQWMRDKWEPKVADATMRRWVKVARDKFEEKQ